MKKAGLLSKIGNFKLQLLFESNLSLGGSKQNVSDVFVSGRVFSVLHFPWGVDGRYLWFRT